MSGPDCHFAERQRGFRSHLGIHSRAVIWILAGLSLVAVSRAEEPETRKPKTVLSRLLPISRVDTKAPPPRVPAPVNGTRTESLPPPRLPEAVPSRRNPVSPGTERTVPHPADDPAAYREMLRAARDRQATAIDSNTGKAAGTAEKTRNQQVGFEQLDESRVLDPDEPTPPLLPLVPGTDPEPELLYNHRPPDGSPPYFIGPENDRPTGWTGWRVPNPFDMEGGDFFPVQDRYRVGLPGWDRYVYGSPWNPYNQNVLKGDYPIIPGTEQFFNVTAVNETLTQLRRRPVNPAGTDEDRQFRERFFLTTDYFKDDNTFTPSPWFFRITQAFEFRDQTDQGDTTDYAWQEAFADFQLAIISDYYDTIDLKVGRQLFVSDFRGFLYTDLNDMAVLSGTWAANRYQWRVMVADTKQIDPVSQFVRTWENREQTILGADVFRQDWPWLGMFVYGGVFYNHDYLKNQVDAVYLELAAQGVIGDYQVSGAFIQALGKDNFNPIARRDLNINAQLVALEVTRPTDWWVPRGSILYTSGDSSPTDGHGRGFDAIFDNPAFAGANVAFFNREAINARGVTLTNTNSFLPNLRNKAFDAANFVNPGLVMTTAGLDTVLSTRTKAFFNTNWYWLAAPEAVEEAIRIRNQGLNVDVGNSLGVDYTIGITHKPLIIDNITTTVGLTAFDQGPAMQDLTLTDETLYTTFMALTLIY